MFLICCSTLEVTETRFWTCLFQAMRAGAMRLPISYVAIVEAGRLLVGECNGTPGSQEQHVWLTDSRKHDEKGRLADDCRDEVDAQADLDNARQDVVEFAKAERYPLDVGAHERRGGEFPRTALVDGERLLEYLGHEDAPEERHQPVVEVIIAGARNLVLPVSCLAPCPLPGTRVGGGTRNVPPVQSI